MFGRNGKFRDNFGTLRLDLRLIRAFADSGCIILVFHPQQFVILSRLAVRALSTEAYTSTLRRCSGRNWSKFGVRKMRKKEPLTERLHFTCGQLQLLTSNHSPRNRGTLLMGCVRVSGAPDSSRRQHKRLTRCFRGLQVESQQHKKNAKSPTIATKMFHLTRGNLQQYHGYIAHQKRLSPNRLLVSRRTS